MSHRFFADATSVSGDRATLRGAAARQIARVLRLRPGDTITLVVDVTDSELVLDTVSAREVGGRIIRRSPSRGEPRFALTLALPVLRGDRSEEVIESVTQLGVWRIAPFVSVRSVARNLSAARHQRWERIAHEAAETARRGRAPSIDPLRDWRSLLVALPSPVLVAWEEERERRLRDAFPSGPSGSLVIGPEGGLSGDEIALARDRGAVTVSLGRRRLRSETAAIAAVAELLGALD